MRSDRRAVGKPDTQEEAVSNTTCPNCKGKGYTSAPYMLGLKTGGLYTITICACEESQKKAAELVEMIKKIPEDE